MIGCLRTRVRKQPIVVLYFEFETVLKFYNLETRTFRQSITCSVNALIIYSLTKDVEGGGGD